MDNLFVNIIDTFFPNFEQPHVDPKRCASVSVSEYVQPDMTPIVQ